MNYVWLAVATLGVSAQDILRKQLDKRGEAPKGATLAMTFVTALAVLVLFVIMAGFRLIWHVPSLPYSLVFSVTYALAIGSSMLAVMEGPLSLTSLVTACSMLLPAVHGVVFLGEPLGVMTILGLVLLFCSLCLVCLEKNARCSKRWYFYAAVLFVSNGMCTIVPKLHQLRFDGAYKSEFMVYAMALIAVACLVWMVIRLRADALPAVRHVGVSAAGVGLCNGITNFLAMYLSIRLPAAIMYPILSGGSLLLTCVLARAVFQEKVSRKQTLGIICGIVAVVVMNL